jgi:formate-dependent nitrite reductase membrane component NrfD
VIATRYRRSVDPVETDGRDINLDVGQLLGEASQQKAGPVEQHMQGIAQTWHRLPEPREDDPTYYDRPLLKEPVWKPYIPLYYFIGGTAGASLVLGAAAQFDGSHELDPLVRRCHWIGIIGSSIGGVLLIADLGRPERFMAMLRVFRPTSPMNMGAWVLSAAPSAAFVAGLFARRKPGFLGNFGEAAGYSSGVFGAALATYTGVLVANSAIPLWSEARKVLPILFGASAMASAASIFDLLYDDPRACRVTHWYGMAGRVAELAAGVAMEHRLAETPRVALPLRRGLTGLAWRTAAVLTAASLVATVLPNQNRKKRVVAGVLGLAGSLTLRFAVHYAGARSARDPRASFHLQRGAAQASERVIAAPERQPEHPDAVLS